MRKLAESENLYVILEPAAGARIGLPFVA